MSVAVSENPPEDAPLPRGFHWLTVTDVRRETVDATSFGLQVPDDLADAYRFTQGQFLTFLRYFDGERIRRPYSICTAPDDGELRVCVKRMPHGRFSTWINTELRPGARIPVMIPMGRFYVPVDPGAAREYVGISGGSGITPIMSIIRTVMAREPRSRFTLFYGNRDAASVIFREALADLKDRYLERFRVFHVLSDAPDEAPLLSGMLTGDKVSALVNRLTDPAAVDHWFICGPGPMMEGAQAALAALGVPADRVKVESFGDAPPVHAGAVAAPSSAASASAAPSPATRPAADGDSAAAVLILHGKRHEVRVPYDGRVLDAALAADLDMPFACKGGVCCTCKARLVEGEVDMAVNFGLEPEEVEAGYILTCQSQPTTDRLVIDYDARY